MEKEYKDLTPKAKRGINKFGKMSTKEMDRVGNDYEKKTGNNPNNVNEKDEFFEFVADWRR